MHHDGNLNDRDSQKSILAMRIVHFAGLWLGELLAPDTKLQENVYCFSYNYEAMQ